MVGMKKAVPKSAAWLVHNKTFTPLEKPCQADLSRASDGDGEILDLKAFEQRENGAVLAEIIVHWIPLVYWETN